jgi:hypothetical protein
VGTDGIPREFYKYDLRPLLELVLAAINAFLCGQEPTMCGHEWMRAFVTLIAKKLLVLHVSEFHPVASICTKYILCTRISSTNVFISFLMTIICWKMHKNVFV